MITLKTVIVDDEYLARRLLNATLHDFPEIDIVAECSNGQEMIEAISTHQPELIFLDIKMPGKNGIDIVKSLSLDVMPMIIFTTAYDQYAVSAFDLNAVDYLLKPLDEKQVARSVQRAITEYTSKNALNNVKEHLLEVLGQIDHRPLSAFHNTNHKNQNNHNMYESTADMVIEKAQQCPEKLVIKDAGNITLVTMKDIDWIDAAGDYMCVHSQGNTHIMRITMTDLLNQLSSEIFKRVHRSTIINMTKIERAVAHTKGEFFVYLSCGEQLKVSRSYGDVMKEHLAHTVL